MYIKLKIEGELLKALETDAEEYVRTCTQQAMYIIKSHYKNKNKKNLIIHESSTYKNTETNMKEEELFKDEIDKEFLEVSNIEKEELESDISSDEFIDEEIYNF